MVHENKGSLVEGPLGVDGYAERSMKRAIVEGPRRKIAACGKRIDCISVDGGAFALPIGYECYTDIITVSEFGEQGPVFSSRCECARRSGTVWPRREA